MQANFKRFVKYIQSLFLKNESDIRSRMMPYRITFIYAAAGCLWILFSDILLDVLIDDMTTITRLQTYKGWFYVLATSVLIFYMTHRDVKKLDHANSKLQQGNKMLEEANNSLTSTKAELDNQLKKLNESEELLKASEERYRLALEGSNDGIWDWDIINDEIFLSDRFKDTLGITYSKSVSSLKSWFSYVHPEDVGQLKEALKKCITGISDQLFHKFRIISGGGETIWVLGRGKVIRNKDNTPVRMAGSLTNISSQVEAEERIRNLAYYDRLTALPNREYFMEYLCVEINKIELAENELTDDEFSKLAIMYLDLDNFKSINDTYGHTVGDMLIAAVGGRLISVLDRNDFLSRFSGDEFMILLRNFNSFDDIEKFAQKIINILKQPIFIGDYELYMTGSIGIAVYPNDGSDVYELVRNADTAMYEAKAKGKNDYRFYSREMNIKLAERLETENILRQAIYNNEFSLHYQPQICARTGKVVGMEALIRWYNPEKGYIPPAKFISIAEESGLIIPIGSWVLDAVCSFADTINKAFPQEIGIAINISAKQFRSKNLLDTIVNATKKYNIKPQQLEIEITESTAIDDIDYTIKTIQQLRDMGFRITIDDFGTGYSSLNYIKMFPINGLKMDMSFVRDITHDKKVQAIAKTILSLAHDLNLVVTAEGVETEEQYNWLREQKCDIIQGYFFSKPLPQNEINSFLKSRQ
ncbi:MAG: EAL domain-containing protein [Bacillota bacterium]